MASALEQIAEDFLAKTLELGAAVARRRKSDYLTPADLNIALERIWYPPLVSHCDTPISHFLSSPVCHARSRT